MSDSSSSESSSLKSPVALVHTIPGDLMQVRTLHTRPLSDAGTPLDLHEREVVRCLRKVAGEKRSLAGSSAYTSQDLASVGRGHRG